jgi:hypothetical protein
MCSLRQQLRVHHRIPHTRPAEFAPRLASANLILSQKLKIPQKSVGSAAALTAEECNKVRAHFAAGHAKS